MSNDGYVGISNDGYVSGRPTVTSNNGDGDQEGEQKRGRLGPDGWRKVTRDGRTTVL